MTAYGYQRNCDHYRLRPLHPQEPTSGRPLSLPNLIGQEFFDGSLDGMSIRSVGFGRITLGSHPFDERIGYIDAEMPQVLPFAAAVLRGAMDSHAGRS